MYFIPIKMSNSCLYNNHFISQDEMVLTETLNDSTSKPYEITGSPQKTIDFYSLFQQYIYPHTRNTILSYDDTTTVSIAGYDAINNMGIEFQDSSIMLETVLSKNKSTELDWMFNMENQYMKKVNIHNTVICEIPASMNGWKEAVKAIDNNVFLYTASTEWIWLTDRESYQLETESGIIKHCWVGEVCSFQDVLENTCLQSVMTPEGIDYFTTKLPPSTIEEILIVYARCKASMEYLDTVHRDYVNRHAFKHNDVLAIKAVAGGGKTTTLLTLAKIHTKKRILYTAFNKSLVTEIKDKIKKQNMAFNAVRGV